MTSAPPSFDDPAALVALLKQWHAPDALLDALTLKGFKSLASIAYAIPKDGSPDDFVRKLWPPADGSSEAIVSPAAAFARRLVVQTQAVAHPPASPAPIPGPSLPSAPAAKISAAAAETMREKFITDYPGELLSPANTPSIEFLNRLRSELDAPTSLWIPWRLRTSESDLQHFYESRRPRSDAQLLRGLLEGVPDPVVAQSSAPTSGPVEPTLRRHLGLLITALAFLGDLHLRAGKMLLEAFVAAVVEQPIDTTLRPPSMQEVIAAERTVWSNVATLMRDEKWSLPDSVTEITVTRHMLPNILVARPRSIPATGKKPISELWDDSWHSVDESGKEICIAILENPASSLLWLVPGCRSWIRHHCMHSVEVAACSHALDYRKSWLFVSNFSDLSSLASVCQHPPGSHAMTSGRRTASGAFLTRDTACYPSSLCSALADLFKPLLSSHTGEIPFRSWHSLLPATLFWPIPANRVEDGAGTCSSASWSVPRGADCFGSLRKAWCARILSGDFLSKFQAKLSSGSKAPPLSDPELAPFLEDLRSFLRLSAPDFNTLLSIPPGQPFRLFLLEALLSVFKDPDTSFVDLLTEGVPLGVDSEMPSCPTLFPPAGQSAPTMDLTHCSSSWGSALSDQASVDSLLSEEISEGWVREVPGGLDELTARYQQTAVGKLGLVKSPGRPDRLVVDSSVSGVTEHTSLPNKSANPSISGLRQCLPPEHAIEWLIALILDVSKAHRRIKIRDSDRGLLCFFHRNRLYQCLTLNFGARPSGFYWSRMAGLLTRLLHRLVFVKHCLLIYVDDLIALLSGPSGPVWAALMCIMLLILRVPMSWHKAYLGPRPTWIGWSICLHSLSATMEAPKLDRLRDLLAKIRGSDSVPLHLLRKLTGKLLWVCSLFRPFRPSLAPLYSDQGKPPVVHVALSPAKWASFRSKLDSHLVLQSDVGLASCPKLCTLISVSGREVSSLSQVPVSFPGERRTWISVRMPPESDRKLSKESLAVLDMWHACLADAAPTFPLPLAREFPCQAFADACADAQHAGIGGFVTLPSGKTAWFQHRFSASELAALFPWFPVGTSPQACIAAWELLGQIALLWVIGLLIPVSLHPIHVVTRCDNSPSDSASWKGLSTARGICSLLPAYFAWQRAFCISTYIDHVPGFQNTVADGLSRGADPATFGLRPCDRVDIPWALISRPPRPSYHPPSALNLSLFPAMDF
ncbi:LRRC45 [Symbiodinium sp. CCMP2592]|nr:LRRC45 [Symbiodinium sp. CCMP2592]